jgi:uncharacterized protein (DUF362 family)/Pyruvate/2-oxoacid:ferredoxin oxidoreductase delta subunit
MESPRTNPPVDSATVLVTEADYERMGPALDRVLEGLDLGGWFAGLRGKKVFIKPNMLGLFPPESHTATHPSLVSALVALMRSAGAEVTVGDNSGVGGYGINERAARHTGIAAASDGAYVNVARDTVQVKLDSRFLQTIVVSRAMLEADVLVSVPKMKTHGLTVVTGAVKNMFGLVAGAGKGGAHAAAPGLADFGTLLAEIHSLRPPDLTIMDAVMTMEGNGPSAGTLKPLGRLIASPNAVAADAIMCEIMGYPPGRVHHLAAANRLGLGPLAREAITVIGQVPAGAKYRLPVTANHFSFLGWLVNRSFFPSIARSRLTVDESKCKGCRLCVDGCPTGAMQMGDRFPRVDAAVCIRCYCCQELCPESAWRMTSLLGRMMRSRR